MEQNIDKYIRIHNYILTLVANAAYELMPQALVPLSKCMYPSWPHVVPQEFFRIQYSGVYPTTNTA